MYRENSPSQPRGRLVESIIPSVPFEAIVADYCQLEGCHYFAVGDRLFTRTEVQKVTPGSKTSRERGVYSALHQNFARFGVPEELSIDCRPEFVVQETQDFLRRWGVKYRLSSAYHPSSNGRAKLAVKSTKKYGPRRDNRHGSLSLSNAHKEEHPGLGLPPLPCLANHGKKIERLYALPAPRNIHHGKPRGGACLERSLGCVQ